MKVVVAPDSFGGALDSVAVANAIASGWSRIRASDEVVRAPMADGGEGTLRALSTALGPAAEVRRSPAADPLGRPIEAEWLLLRGGRDAFVELAAASGLALLRPAERDARRATSRGTGDLIRAALDAGVERLTLGVGGSATTDGGAGLLSALGARFLDAGGDELADGGWDLARLERIDLSGLDPRLDRVALTVATDVTNPLCGANGAAATYGPQKGADDVAVRELDAALAHFAAVVERSGHSDRSTERGAGAAGGTAFGLIALTNAAMRPGFEVVAELIGLESVVDGAGMVITGEGRSDGQTLQGKTAAGVLSVATRAGAPVILLCGGLGPGAEALDAAGFALVQPIVDAPMSLEEAMAATAPLLEAAAARVARAVELGRMLPPPA